MKKTENQKNRNWYLSGLSLLFAVLFCFVTASLSCPATAEAASVSLSNPAIETDSTMTAGQKVTYDCVWFGSYPQTEVVLSGSAEETALVEMNENYTTKYESVSEEEFAKIEEGASNCDTNGDFTVDGVKYRKMTKGDAIYTANSSNYYYEWTDDTSYHYFKYEPIKWRVLQVSDGKALLLADVALDDQQYNTTSTSITWEKSTIRSWLNSYNKDLNSNGVDYSASWFLGTAINSSEQAAIESTSVENADNLTYGTEGGKNTTDRIFLLSESEVYSTDTAVSYGFVSSKSTYDEARRAVPSTYAYGRGIYRSTSSTYTGNCNWWLRSPGCSSSHAAEVSSGGYGGDFGSSVSDGVDGVRPALYLNLSSSNLYSYAGTVCSNGDVTEIYNVTFESNGGSEVDSQSITQNASNDQTVTEPDAPTKSGYTFAGWYTDADLTQEYDFTKAVTANLTLYAKWKEISGPTIETDSSMTAGQKVTYDCVWFGSYPQTEVVSESDETQLAALEKMNTYYKTEYETVSAEDFQEIVSADYDENGDATVDGVKYRRMKKGEALYTVDSSDYWYNWTDETSYHYFKYEPIKWRVLQVENEKALLLSDVVLDDQRYNTTSTDITWEKSTIRSWLNNYDGASNDAAVDYSSSGFLEMAFTSSEQAAIADTSVKNTDNLTYGTEGGEDTTDKIFLLSESEVYSTDTAVSYGFVSSKSTYDEARRAVPSTYAYGRGIYRSTSSTYSGNCNWWLRSPGYYSYSTVVVIYSGSGNDGGGDVHNNDGVRPALYLDLSSTETYSGAGTVSSDEVLETTYYTVTFESNDGTAVDAQKIAENKTATKPSDPTKSGYTFAGWYTDADLTQEYDFSTLVTADITLYAKWQPNTYTIAYNANGGSGAPSSQTKTYGVTLTLSSTKPTRTGYTFLGWSTSSSATSASYSAGGSFTTNATTTLYAVWQIKTYTITYDLNGGTGAIDSQTADYGTSVTLSTEVPTRDGYDFLGWALSADATESAYESGAEVEIEGDLVLYAVWEKQDSSGDSDSDVAPTSASLTSEDRRVKYKNMTDFTTEASGTNLKYQYFSATSLTGEGTSISNESDSPSISFQPTKTQYVYCVVSNSAGSVTTSRAKVTVYYVITYDANGGSDVPSSQEKDYGVDLTLSSTEPTRTGYDFLGWSTSSSATSASYSAGGSFTTNATTTLYAVWQLKTYTITYDANGGNGAPSSQTKDYGVDLTLSNTKPTRTGYTFLGWATSEDSTEVTYQPGGSYTANLSGTLYAVWQINTYRIKYDANGGSGAPAAVTANYGTTITLSDTVPTKEGYNFLGWTLDVEAVKADYQSGGELKVENNLTLYAVWEKKDSSSGSEDNKDGTTENKDETSGGTTENNNGTSGGSNGDEGGTSSGNQTDSSTQSGSGNSNGSGTSAATQSLTQTITASSKTVALKSKVKLNAKTNGGGKLTYKSSNKKIATVTSSGKVKGKKYGKVTITIKAAANGNYQAATKKITITVVPKATKLKSVKSPAKQKVYISWKKGKVIDGYEIYFSSSKKFKRKKTYGIRVKKSRTYGTAEEKWLSSGKTFYVKIRTYKKVGKKTYYSSWSKIKKVKIK